MVSGPGFGLGSEDRTGPARVRSGQGFRPKTGQVKKGVMVSARLSPLDLEGRVVTLAKVNGSWGPMGITHVLVRTLSYYDSTLLFLFN